MNLQEIYQKLTETREELLGIINKVSRDQLNFRKDSDSWSINQIYQHLITTEELYVVAIRRGLKSQEESSLERRQLDFLLDRSKKIMAPEIARPTNEQLEPQEIIGKLSNSRAKLFELLDSIEDPSVLSRKSFVHPVFKEMLLVEWVEFIYFHEQRHMQQMNEIIESFKGRDSNGGAHL